MEYTIENMRKGKWGKLIAFYDVKFTGYTKHFDMTIKGFKLVEGVNGKFVGMPSQKNSDDEYHDTVYADEETRKQLNDAAIKEYEKEDAGIPEKDEPVAAAKDDLPF